MINHDPRDLHANLLGAILKNGEMIDQRIASLAKYLIGLGFLFGGIIGFLRVVLYQKTVWVGNGLGWDGVEYQKIFDFFRDGRANFQSISFPFCGRIATPLIASFTTDYGLGFYQINLIFSIIFMVSVMTLVFLTNGLDFKSAVGAIFFSLFLFFSPTKFINFYPAYVDPMFLAVISISVLFAIKFRYIEAISICLLAITVREASIYILPLYLIMILSHRPVNKYHLAFSLISFFIGYAIKTWALSITGCHSQSQFIVGAGWIYRIISGPTYFISSIASISMTIGPIFIIARREIWKQISELKGWGLSAISIPYFAFLSVVGGADVTRIFYSFIPFYAGILAFCFKKSSLPAFAMSLLGYFLTNHVISLYPQPISSRPVNDISGFFGQFPEYAHPSVGISIIVTWVILYFTAIFLERFPNYIKDLGFSDKIYRNPLTSDFWN